MLKENFVPPPSNHKFYVYLHRRLDNNDIFYVGKGRIYKKTTLIASFRRAFVNESRTNYWKNINNLYGKDVIIDKTFETELDALNYESELILKYGMIKNGGTLVNCYAFGSEWIERINNRVYTNTIPIHQYDLCGNFIKSFNSITEASIEVKCTPTQLSVAIGNVKGRRAFNAHGYVWSKNKQDKIDIVSEYDKGNKKAVYQYTIYKEFIKKWKSTTEIVDKLHINFSSLRNNLINLSATSSGFYFSYNPPEMIEPIDKTTKICIKCSERKELSEFYDAPVNKDGKMGACITCLKIYKKEKNKKKKEKNKNL